MSNFQNTNQNQSNIKENLSDNLQDNEKLGPTPNEDANWEEENIPEEINIETPDVEQEIPEDFPKEDEYDEDHESKDRPQEQESRFKDGQVLRFIKVRFAGNAKAFPFFVGKKQFQYGQQVVAMSDRGMMVGYINSFPYERPYDKSMNPIRSIARVATSEDIQQQKDFIIKEKEAEKICLELIEKYKLDMVLTHVEYTQFGKKAVFFFVAPSRVDFRDLVKDLVAKLRMRIELRQISLRDRAAALGGIGVCGLQTCCSSFLSAYGNVSIKMAKNQNLALVPTKLNGVCGQIKCCIKYEDEVYAEKRTRLPKENSFIYTKNGDFGKVLQLTLIEEQFEMLTDRGIIRHYSGELFDPNLPVPAGKVFPDKFEFVTRDTGPILNLTNCQLLPEYLPKKEDNLAEELDDDLEEDGGDEELTDSDADYIEEKADDFNEENEDENAKEGVTGGDISDNDFSDDASPEDVAAEVKHAPPSNLSTMKDDKSIETQSTLGRQDNEPKKQKGQDRAFHRFKKKNKRR